MTHCPPSSRHYRSTTKIFVSASASAALAISSLMTSAVGRAQEFTQVQSLTDRVLFAKEDLATLRRENERRRLQDLDRRAEQQGLLLEEQAESVRQLGGQLNAIRDEQRILDIAATFDTAVLTGNASVASALLANEITLNLTATAGSQPTVVSSGSVVASTLLSSAAGAVLPRTNHQIRVEHDKAVLISDGYAWGIRPRMRRSLLERAGKWEYDFIRIPTGWVINGISFSGQPRLDN